MSQTHTRFLLHCDDSDRRAPAAPRGASRGPAIALCAAAAVIAPLAAQAPTERGAASDRPAAPAAIAAPTAADAVRVQPAPAVAPPHRLREVRRSELDEVLAAWVQADHRSAAALAKIAVERSGSERVATFAEQARKQHLHCVEVLAEFVPEQSGDGEAVAGDPAPEPVRHDSAPRGVNHAVLLHELYRKNLATARAMLDGKSGAAFDRCYLMLQGVHHAHAVDAMQVFAERASPALKAVLEREIPAMQQHAKKALAMATGMPPERGEQPRDAEGAAKDAASDGAGDG
ncbi:MAG: DUF4142 domain-containing protein [Planctomycetota bacterium]